MEVQELINRLSKPVKNSLYFDVLHTEIKDFDKEFITHEEMSTMLNTLSAQIPESAHASMKEEIALLYTTQS